MPWVRFDDNTSEDPKIDHLSDGAFRLWFNAICFANRNLTDGFVPLVRISRLTPNYRPQHMNQLVEAGVFHKEADGITIHGYLRYQSSAAEIKAQREQERKRKAAMRAAAAAASNKDPTTGQFMSHPDNHRDTQGDNHRDTQPESGEVSPATHPTPPPVSNSSSSSEPLVGPPTSEEEEATPAQLAELEQRWVQRQSHDAVARYGPVKDARRWRASTLASIRQAVPVQAVAAEPFRPYDRLVCPNGCANGWLLDDENDDALVRCPACVDRSVSA